ncbi:MAG: response regulator transcription factor [Rikenellaceae bacterium]|nr:response regulator transcription factor [Rikenellaceae bacterium]
MDREIKIALVDDHKLFRNGMRGLIDGCRGCRVVAEASDGAEFLENAEAMAADVVFMDISMPTLSGDKATVQALERNPDLKIICLSMFGDEKYYSLMVEAGAKGFLLKDSSIEEVFAAIEAVVANEEYICQEVMQALSSAMRRKEEADVLSEREIDVLLGICRGLSTQEIAEELFLSKRTVDSHRANILEKTGSKNTASLVVYAIKHSLVEI